MIDLAAQELLKNKLRSVKAEFDQEDVEDYFDKVIVPFLYAENIRLFSLLLCSRENQTIAVETSYAKNYLGDIESYIELLGVVKKFPSNSFTLYTDDGVVDAYTENNLDWILIKYELSAREIIQPLIDNFWVPFFDFA
jgi:hypothetical protein